jgi:sigma-E factor negative regulatory protein RseB
MQGRGGVVLIGAWVAATAVAAGAASPPVSAPIDGPALLKKVANASRQVCFSGTFVYSVGKSAESALIAHCVDAHGEIERLETLDGPPREVIRRNDQVTSYLPASRTIVIEKRKTQRFPLPLPDQLNGIGEHYTISTGGLDRVAGFECRWLLLQPKDVLRYGHRFCAELASGLPLTGRMVDGRNEVMEQMAFSQVTIGNTVNRDLLRSKYQGRAQGWTVDRSTVVEREISGDTGWTVKDAPPGFRKMSEMRRLVQGKSAPVAHLLYSDGLASVSLFVEPVAQASSGRGAASQGNVNVYMHATPDFVTTALGKAPAETVRRFAESAVEKSR